jgi:8-oxo-dGTP pyrophosphatase MutT (NUDIX family)
VEKACPIVLRGSPNQLDILAFNHPLAGKQFVKGTIEPNEVLAAACERELREESGLIGRAVQPLGQSLIECQGLTYGFYRMHISGVIPERFDHFCDDDGGHVFSFFWHPMREKLTKEWHPIFHEIHRYLMRVD